MPPTRQSTSTAHKESDQIAPDQNYTLGNYSFRIERSSVPGSTNDKIEVICIDKDGKNARKSIQIPSSTQLLGWYVEANETEASVYVLIEEGIPGGGTIPTPIPSSSTGSMIRQEGSFHTTVVNGGGVLTYGSNSVGTDIWHFMAASDHDGVSVTRTTSGGKSTNYNLNNTYTFNGKTVYYTIQNGNPYGNTIVAVNPSYDGPLSEQSAWLMIYGDDEKKYEKLVGRFAIDIEGAGGVGPGSDWTDPEDYDEDWEEGDPTHTLYVEVTGALSGRHNDPIVDPSYSYIPANKDTVKDYGCGGDGGHGGGGGAGASTVVIHKFATNQANSKEVTAIARRHGYGSGGGKGGKGGDGCILVYY